MFFVLFYECNTAFNYPYEQKKYYTTLALYLKFISQKHNVFYQIFFPVDENCDKIYLQLPTSTFKITFVLKVFQKIHKF